MSRADHFAHDHRPLLRRAQGKMKLLGRTAHYTARLMTTGILILALGLATIKLFPIVYWLLGSSLQAHSSGIQRQFMKEVSNDSISGFLKEITKDPHVAGTPENFATAAYLRHKFQEFGVSAHYSDYDVFLTYPLKRSLSLQHSNGSLLKLSLREDPVEGDPYSSSSKIIPTFLAYSPSGTVSAQVVYANYGQKNDFDKLRELGVDVNGSIVIARLGKSFRGDIVLNAEKEGAVAALLYTDPQENAANGTQGYYPDSLWLPPSGVQRGSLYLRAGDPLTPGWPSSRDAERLQPSDSSSVILPKIPALPISEQDALPIMLAMEGPVAPDGWKGGLAVSEYRLGKSSAKLHFSYKSNDTVVGIRDVIGVIPGEESDRYVLLGNHRDAWTFGGADPNSGTACLLEIARTFGKLLERGWKPKRTIVLCSWDAEEYGLIGSTEWVEENLEILSARAVAYLNVDVAVHGPGFSGMSTPQLDDLLFEITKMVEDPDSKKPVFSSWCEDETTCVERLGGGSSDYAPFLQHAGIAAFHLTYGDKFPVYHSAYDNYNWMQKFGDPEFHRHAAVCTIWGLLALRLADDHILPFNYVRYADVLEASVKSMEESMAENSWNVSFSPLYSAVAKLRKSAAEINERAEAELSLNKVFARFVLDGLNGMRSHGERMVNDQLLLAERSFLDPEGLPAGKSWYKHLVFGPSEHDVYGTESFPAVTDGISELQRTKKKKKQADARDKLQHEIFRAARAITRAANVLKGSLS